MVFLLDSVNYIKRAITTTKYVNEMSLYFKS